MATKKATPKKDDSKKTDSKKAEAPRSVPDDQKLAVVDIPANEPYPTGGAKEE